MSSYYTTNSTYGNFYEEKTRTQKVEDKRLKDLERRLKDHENIVNNFNEKSRQQIIDAQMKKPKTKEVRNPIEDFMRACYWLTPMPEEFTQESFEKALKEGAKFGFPSKGIKASIVMPKTTPDIKVEAVRRLGGNAILFGNNFDEAYAEAIRLSQEEGLTLIPPYDDPDVIAGQGTIASELLKQNSHITHVFVQVGGGGLAAGIAVYIKQILPHVKVIAVEAEGSACFKAAYDKNEIVTLDRVSMFADGVAVKRIGTETFRVLKDNIDEVVTVSNDQICAALKDIFDDT